MDFFLSKEKPIFFNGQILFKFTRNYCGKKKNSAVSFSRMLELLKFYIVETSIN